MKDEAHKEFDVWIDKYDRSGSASNSWKKVARASWNAAWHLMKKQANAQARKHSERTATENARLRALLDKARDEIDRLEAGLPAVEDDTTVALERKYL